MLRTVELIINIFFMAVITVVLIPVLYAALTAVGVTAVIIYDHVQLLLALL